jgi:ParB family chromosome partitioning protein
MTLPAESAVPPAPATPAVEGAEKTQDKRRALGRGLDSLLPSVPLRPRTGEAPAPHNANSTGGDARAYTGQLAGGAPAPHTPAPHSGVVAEIHAQAAPRRPGEEVLQIPLSQIDPNPYQTRVEFDQEMLEELRESIKANGVIQPIVVRPAVAGRYVLVLGERRCRASKQAGKETIPAIVRRVSEQQAAEMTVIENLQRQDLNCMEQAAAFSKLSREFNLTQAEIGERVGLSRESVANYMRLLKLPGTVMKYLYNRTLGFSEARELLKLEDNDTIAKVAQEAVEKQYSFPTLMDVIEKILMKRNLLPEALQQAPRGARWVDPNVRAAQREIERILGMRVKIQDRKGKGKIVIEYATLDDYERVVELLRAKAN